MSKTVSKLKKDLDIVYSQYIRLKSADDDGFVTCVTCGKNAHYKKGMQAGHYVSRSHNATRYSDDNVHVQCTGCNLFKSGNMDEYALFMIDKYGIEKLDELNKRKQEIKQFTTQELEELITHYKEKVNEQTNK